MIFFMLEKMQSNLKNKSPERCQPCLSLYKAKLFEILFVATVNILVQCALPTFPEISSFFLVSSSSHRRCFIKKLSQKFTEKHLCQSLFCIKIETLAQAFFVNFVKLLGTPFLQNIFGQLLLSIGNILGLFSRLLNITLY